MAGQGEDHERQVDLSGLVRDPNSVVTPTVAAGPPVDVMPAERKQLWKEMVRRKPSSSADDRV